MNSAKSKVHSQTDTAVGTATMQSLPLTEVPGAADAGVEWMVCSGCSTREQALETAKAFLKALPRVEEQFQQLQRLPTTGL